MKDNKFIAQSFVPKTETKIILENQQKPKLSLTARNKVINKSGSNYQSLRAMINTPSYGPGVDGAEVKKHCYKCKKDKEVESSDEYCPGCGGNFNEEFEKAMAIALAESNNSEVTKDISVKVVKDKK